MVNRLSSKFHSSLHIVCSDVLFNLLKTCTHPAGTLITTNDPSQASKLPLLLLLPPPLLLLQALTAVTFRYIQFVELLQ
jgi:hypothetical protein